MCRRRAPRRPAGGRLDQAARGDHLVGDRARGRLRVGLRDFSKEAHGKLARFAPGIASPPHTHTHAYWAVVIQGTLTNPFEDEEDPPEMGPGDSWHVPAGVEHVTACVSEEPCLAYTHMNDLWDITVVEWGASEAGEARE